MSRSLFITFEGGEGAGKTTLIEKFYSSLITENLKVIKTREPGGTPIGEQIRNLLLHQEKYEISELSEILLFLASRVQHIEKIILPALNSGSIVLCDRFNESTIAYQGIARGVGKKLTQQLCQLATESVTPDITFIVDIDPKIGLERAKKASVELDRLEKLNIEFHQKVREGYQLLAKENPQRIFLLDGTKTPGELLHQALEVFKKIFSCP